MSKLKQVVQGIPLPMKIYNGKWTWEDVKWPVIAMQKYDGIFVWRWSNHILSKENKPITNAQVVCRALEELPDKCNAEIVLEGASFHEIQSYVARIDAEDHRMKFEKFDMAVPHERFTKRLSRIIPEPLQYLCSNSKEVSLVYDNLLKIADNMTQPFEGLVLKYAYGNYYFNHRTTRREALAFKYVPEHEGVGVIWGWEPCSNPDRNIIGAYKVETTKWGNLTIGSGFDNTTPDQARKNLGKKITFKYKLCGMKDFPRQPIMVTPL